MRGVFAPRFAFDPLVVAPLDAAIICEHLAHAHRAGEAAGVIDVEANRITGADIHIRGLLFERNEELLRQAPNDERAELRGRRHSQKRDLAELELRLTCCRDRPSFGVEVDEDVDFVALGRADRNLGAEEEDVFVITKREDCAEARASPKRRILKRGAAG